MKTRNEIKAIKEDWEFYKDGLSKKKLYSSPPFLAINIGMPVLIGAAGIYLLLKYQPQTMSNLTVLVPVLMIGLVLVLTDAGNARKKVSDDIIEKFIKDEGFETIMFDYFSDGSTLVKVNSDEFTVVYSTEDKNTFKNKIEAIFKECLTQEEIEGVIESLDTVKSNKHQRNKPAGYYVKH